jgi:hypothetical protein
MQQEQAVLTNNMIRGVSENEGYQEIAVLVGNISLFVME